MSNIGDKKRRAWIKFTEYEIAQTENQKDIFVAGFDAGVIACQEAFKKESRFILSEGTFEGGVLSERDRLINAIKYSQLLLPCKANLLLDELFPQEPQQEGENKKLKDLLERAKPWVQRCKDKNTCYEEGLNEWLKEFDEVMK